MADLKALRERFEELKGAMEVGLFGTISSEDVDAVLELIREAEPRVMTVDTTILDATCGNRTIWFQKHEPHTIYCDKRREEWEGDFGKALRADGKKKHRHLVIDPDVQCDFTALPFENDSFYLVVFDPPHIVNLSDTSWMRKSYGSLDGDCKPMIRDGFSECMRVLKPYGTLIFKWSDISVSTRDIIDVIGHAPLFGHRSGRKMGTHWMTFMKFPEQMRGTPWVGGDGGHAVLDGAAHGGAEEGGEVG